MENEIRVAKLSYLDVLDCPVCFEPLTIPIFQCDDGHLVCNFCLAKVSNKCPGPGCDLPIGDKRCFPMEKVLEAAFVPCRNAELGCTQSFSYGKVSGHERECNFCLCSCPNLECNYTGPYNSIYTHLICRHVNKSKIKIPIICRNLGSPVGINISEKVLVLWDPCKTVLFVVQCFRERHGVYVTVRSIATSAPEIVKIAYWLSYSVDGHKVTYKIFSPISNFTA